MYHNSELMLETVSKALKNAQKEIVTEINDPQIDDKDRNEKILLYRDLQTFIDIFVRR